MRHQPAEQRGQVHRTRADRRSRQSARRCGAGPARRRDRRRGHGTGNRARESHEDLRRVRSGGLEGPHRRHGAGPGHQPEFRAPDAGRPRRREHAREGERVHVLVRGRRAAAIDAVPGRVAHPIPTGARAGSARLEGADRGRRGDQSRSARRAAVAPRFPRRARRRAPRKPSWCTTSGIPIWCSWTCACRAWADWKPSGGCGQRGSKAAIIAVTASGLADTESEAREAGVDAFVRKPYREGELLAAIGERLGVRYVYGSLERSRSVRQSRCRRAIDVVAAIERPAAGADRSAARRRRSRAAPSGSSRSRIRRGSTRKTSRPRFGPWRGTSSTTRSCRRCRSRTQR